jgi:AhpD family alkylhydroperoxidase
MKERIDYRKVAPEAYKAMLGIEAYVRGSGLDRSLLELVKTRVSQINGCAHCLDMHTKEARAAGETEQRLYLLPAWREAPFYSDRERAALVWTEALTQISTNDVPDELYVEVRRHFDEKALRRPHARDHRDQWLEPPRGPVPLGDGKLSAEGGADGMTEYRSGS